MKRVPSAPESKPHGKVRLAEFDRPESGPTWNTGCPHLGRRIGWRSGTDSRRRTLSIRVHAETRIEQVRVYGVFGVVETGPRPAFGEVVAAIGMFNGDTLIHRFELTYAKHILDTRDLSPKTIQTGDGCSFETLGAIEIDGIAHRFDRMKFEWPEHPSIDRIEWSVESESSSFTVFDVEYDVAAESHGCPFHSSRTGIALNEIPAIVRVGDRAKLSQAIEQVQANVATAVDLDEARGQALTFIAVLTAAFLERGGDRSLHRVQLDAARDFERLSTASEVAARANSILFEIAEPFFETSTNPTSQMIDEAMRFVDRHFAKEVSDEEIANRLGLSTSHFRHLFRQAAGQPFHRYVVSVRLEQAKRLLCEQGATVSEAATAVGFLSVSHFSRAFSHRFGASPNQLRRIAS